MIKKDLKKLSVTDQKSVVGGFVYHFKFNGADHYYVPDPLIGCNNCIGESFDKEEAIGHELEAGRNPDVFDYRTEIEARLAAGAEAMRIAIKGKKLWESLHMDEFFKYMKISAKDL